MGGFHIFQGFLRQCRTGFRRFRRYPQGLHRLGPRIKGVRKSFVFGRYRHAPTSKKRGNRLWSLSGGVCWHPKAIPFFALPAQGFKFVKKNVPFLCCRHKNDGYAKA
jgi:hypothetical protein